MKLEELLSELDKIKLHKQKMIGASLKKPLLLLLLISRIEEGKGENNQFRFTEIEKDLDLLIRNFGGRNVNKSGPEQPFHHLNSSVIWDVKVPYGVEFDNKRTLSKSILRDPETYGYFEPTIFSLLQSDEQSRARIVAYILEKFWPETIQADIRDYLQLSVGIAQPTKKRNQLFAKEVLANYRYRCGVCGFSSVFNSIPFGIDAAHVFWHAYGGPDDVSNGIALCKTHHWALDRGVITIKPKTFEIVVSPRFVAQENNSIAVLEQLNGTFITNIRETPPSDYFLEWHNENVYVR